MADVTPTRAVKLSLGGRYDGYSTFGGSFNPRVALILKPYEAGNVKLMFGKAFRAPSTYEQFFSEPDVQEPNTHLKAESMYSAEIEYSHRFTPTVLGLVSVYENVITEPDRERDRPSEPPGGIYENTGTPVGTMGAEGELRKEWKDGWTASASYSFARSVFLKNSSLSSLASLARDPAFREVPNAPPHLASLRGGAPILGRALMAMTRVAYTSSRYDVHDVQSTPAAPQPAQQQTGDAVIWDLMLTRRRAAMAHPLLARNVQPGELEVLGPRPPGTRKLSSGLDRPERPHGPRRALRSTSSSGSARGARSDARASPGGSERRCRTLHTAGTPCPRRT